MLPTLAFCVQWSLLMTWNGKHRASGLSSKSTSSALTWVTRRGNLPPSPRTTAGHQSSMRASSSECPLSLICSTSWSRRDKLTFADLYRVFSVSFQLTGHWGRAGELRAASVREGLLLRQGGPHRGHGRAAGEGHSQQGQRHLLDAAGQTRPHGRDGPDGVAHPLSAQQRRCGERIRQTQVRPAFGRRGPQLRGGRGERESTCAQRRTWPAKCYAHIILTPA